MKTSKNILIGLLAIVAVVAVAVAWREHAQIAQLEAALLNIGNPAAVKQKLARSEPQSRDLQEQLATQPAIAPGNAAGPGGRGGRGPNQNEGRGPRADFQVMMDRPEIQQLRAVQQKAALDPRFATLFKALKLNPDQLDKLKNLLVEKESTLQDVMAAAREQGVSPRSNPEGFRQLVASAQQEVDNSIKAVLGEEGFAQYQAYERTAPQQNLVKQLQQSLSYTSEPLSEVQAAQLVQVLAATAPAQTVQPATPPDGPPGGRGQGGGTAQISPAAIAGAQTILSASQLQALQQLQQAQQAEQQIQRAMRDSGVGGPGGGRGFGAARASTGG